MRFFFVPTSKILVKIFSFAIILFLVIKNCYHPFINSNNNNNDRGVGGVVAGSDTRCIRCLTPATGVHT